LPAVEIALPSVFGTALAQYSLKLDEVKKDYDYHKEWLRKMGDAPNPSIEWIEEVLRLEETLRGVEEGITDARANRDLGRLGELERQRDMLRERIGRMRASYPNDFLAALNQWQATHPQQQQGGGEVR